MKEKYCRAKQFIDSHLWCRGSLILLLSVILVTFAGRWYLREAFIDYIEKNTYSAENTVLSSANVMLEVSFQDLLQLGGTMAVNQELADVVSAYQSNRDGAYEASCVYDMLGEYARRSQWVSAVTIVDEHGVLYQFDRNQRGSANTRPLWDQENKQWFENMYEGIQEKVRDREIPQYKMSPFPSSLKGMNMFHLAFPLKGRLPLKEESDRIPMLILSIDAEIFNEFIEGLYDSSGQLALGYLMDDNDEIFLHRNPGYIGMKKEEYLSSDGINLQEPIAGMGLTANIYIDGTILQDQVSNIYNRGMMIYNIFFVAALIVIFFAIKWALKPVESIRESIIKVRDGNFRELIQIDGSHEIWQLAEEYNRMIVTVRTMYEERERQYQEKVKAIRMKQEAERRTLESQINAHFICNTLNVINYEVMEAGNHKVSVLIKKLSNILRYTFEQRMQNVYMLQEIAWIEQYLFLQKSRLMDTFEYEIDFPDEYREWPCRKLMLQPFVENSILHGFEGWQEGGRLKIQGMKEGDCLKIIISDNGNGMDEERKRALQSILEEPVRAKELNMGIGISNVTMRMRMYYGERLRIFLETEKDHGTVFTFLLPWIALKGGKEL